MTALVIADQPSAAALVLDATSLTHWLNEQARELFPLPIPTSYLPGERRPVQPLQVRIDPVLRGKLKHCAGYYTSSWRGDGEVVLNAAAFTPLEQDGPALAAALEAVLLHELCHHVQRHQHGHGVASHGREFRELMWHINGQLQRDVVTTYHSLQLRPAGAEAEKLQRRALALLARTTSSNEHEAALAAAKYTELSLAFDLQLDPATGALAQGLPPHDDVCVHVAKRADAWRRELLQAIADVNSCKLYWQPKAEFVQFRLVGRPHKIDQAYDTVDYLLEAIERCMEAERKAAKQDPWIKGEKQVFYEAPCCMLDSRAETLMYSSAMVHILQRRSGRSYWGAFREGVVASINSRMRADHKRRLQEGIAASDNGMRHVPALVVQDHFRREQEAVESTLKDRGYSFRSSEVGGHRHGGGHQAGRAAGKQISLNRQVRSGPVKQLAGR